MYKQYLFSKTQRLLIALFGLLIIAHTVVSNLNWKTSVDNFYRPYSTVIFIIIITLSLYFLKKENWKQKLRVIVLLSMTSFILFNTFLQLGSYFNGQNMGVEHFNAWGIYRMSKIILLDIFAIFTFFAINYTINKLED